jgi:hypothetical protein
VFDVGQAVGAGLLGGGAGGGGDLVPAGAGLAGGSDGVALAPGEQAAQLMVGGQGIKRSDTGRCGGQTSDEDLDLIGVTGLAGFGDLVGKFVPVAPDLPGAQQIDQRG